MCFHTTSPSSDADDSACLDGPDLVDSRSIKT
jgi:hypothetical protein